MRYEQIVLALIEQVGELIHKALHFKALDGFDDELVRNHDGDILYYGPGALKQSFWF